MHKFAKVNLSNQFMVDMGKVLGKGSTGSVYEGTDLRTHSKVAVKVIELSTIDNQVTQYLLKMEKIALMELRSPYVLKGLKVMQDGKYCFIVTEYCNGGTLKKHIQDNRRLSEQTSLKIVKAILEGYLGLVEKKVVHRDLKPANIMMHDEYPKIIDFGYCEIEGYAKPGLQYNVGSPSYMSPESYQDSIYNEKTEIWAIGVILYECLTGKTLDEGMKMTQIFKQLQEQGVQYPEHVSERPRKIIDECLQTDPKNRPTCSELLKKHFPESQSELKLSTLMSQKTMPTQRKIPTSKSIIMEQLAPSQNLETVQKKDILASQSKIQARKTHQPRTPFGVLTNQHQQHQQCQPIKPIQQNKQFYPQNRTRPSYTQYQRNHRPSYEPYFQSKFAEHRPDTTRKVQNKQPEAEYMRSKFSTEYNTNLMMRSTMFPTQSKTQQQNPNQPRRSQYKEQPPQMNNFYGPTMSSNRAQVSHSMHGNAPNMGHNNNGYRMNRQQPLSPASQGFHPNLITNDHTIGLGRNTVAHGTTTERMKSGSYYA